jgi:3-oxoacyl-[acyl-carrier-protein] synthase III
VKVRDFHITGLGTYLPELCTVEQAVRDGLCDPATAEIGWVSTRVAGDVPAPQMAVEAVRQAMRRSGHTAPDIDLLLHACVSHQGPDGWSPQHYVQRHAVGGHAEAVGVRQGCNGMLVGLDLAVCYLAAVPERTAAVVAAADNFGAPLFDRWRADRTMVYGDMACALVLSKRPGPIRLLAVESLSLPELEELGRGAEPLFPPGATVGRSLDFEARMASCGAGLLEEAKQLGVSAYADVVKRTLDSAGLDSTDVTRVTHPAVPGSPLFRRMLFGPLGLDTSVGSFEFGCRNGRSGAGDQVLGLDHLLRTGQVGPGDHVLMLGLGPGISISGAAVQIVERPAWLD